MTKRLLLVLPGSFDPVTRAHVAALRCARDFYLGIDATLEVEALLIPTSDKYGWKKLTANRHRLEMCQQAANDYPWLGVSEIEMEDEEWRRTRFVIEELAQNYSERQLKFVCGTDKINELKDWQYPDDIVAMRDLCGFSCVQRGEEKIDQEVVKMFDLEGKLDLIPAEETTKEVSSSLVRNRLSHGESVSELLHPLVEKYLRENELYSG